MKGKFFDGFLCARPLAIFDFVISEKAQTHLLAHFNVTLSIDRPYQE